MEAVQAAAADANMAVEGKLIVAQSADMPRGCTFDTQKGQAIYNRMARTARQQEESHLSIAPSELHAAFDAYKFVCMHTARSRR